MTRRNEPTTLSTLLSGDADEAVRRVTRRDMDQWAAKFHHRRQVGHRKGKFTPRRLFPLLDFEPGADEEADRKNPRAKFHGMLTGFLRYYGIEDDEISLGYEPVEKVLAQHPDFPVPSRDKHGEQRPADHIICARLNPELFRGL